MAAVAIKLCSIDSACICIHVRKDSQCDVESCGSEGYEEYISLLMKDLKSSFVNDYSYTLRKTNNM